MKTKIFYTFTVVLLIASALLAFNNKLKKFIFHKVNVDKVKVLTTLLVDINNTGTRYKFVKIKNNDGIFVEVYHFNNNKKQHKKLDRIKLKYKKDGFYKFGKEASNLFSTDLNNDGLLEIIAPTHSPQLKPHLNILNFNLQTKKLEFVSNSLLNL